MPPPECCTLLDESIAKREKKACGRGTSHTLTIYGISRFNPPSNQLSRLCSDIDRWSIAKMVQALLRIAPQSRILACGIFQRKDVDDGTMERANMMLKELAGEINKHLDGENVFWVDAPGGVKKEEHVVDHAHLNEEGYRIWDEVLYPKIIGLLT
ncbi:uncharacterized protein RAG0_12549 [Rhynchosporium agropyri]|uniref:SGNH hydrolase-type esterase domain-containing protein n=1 Tax=Rhynchosporium agropyri TaxID=914238 RepID=A0A1E1L8U7_9HELO|nr:uncharacterized protein RAG0_12549 [Rhynchosporium agropyri]